MILKKGKIEAIKERKTRIDIVVSTKETIDPLEAMQLQKTEGYFLFNPDEIKKTVEDAMKDKKIGVDMEGKSPSQKLRGQIVMLWQESDEEISMENYYQREMEKIINHYRNKRR